MQEKEKKKWSSNIKCTRSGSKNSEESKLEERQNGYKPRKLGFWNFIGFDVSPLAMP